MRNIQQIVLAASAAALLAGSLVVAPVAQAGGGKAPSSSVCDNKENPPTDAATQGGCIAVDRRKGNCHSCHMISGINYGNIAPPLVAMESRFPDKAKLRAQVVDARKANPNTVMPPFGTNGILSDEEIDKVVAFLYTL